jgi:putative phosphoribosyl transferase
MDKYLDRRQAGKILAKKLMAYANRDDVFVFALPRGGVPVAFEIARALHAPLDVFIVRKLGVPHHRELAMGAIAMGNVRIFNEDIIKELDISTDDINAVMAEEQTELMRRETVYRGNKPFPELQNKTVILVDDGIATGASMRAAITAIKSLQVSHIVLAVPVASEVICDEFESLVDDFICPLRLYDFHAVGLWYEDFPQTEDEEVHYLLKQADNL